MVSKCVLGYIELQEMSDVVGVITLDGVKESFGNTHLWYPSPKVTKAVITWSLGELRSSKGW